MSKQGSASCRPRAPRPRPRQSARKPGNERSQQCWPAIGCPKGLQRGLLLQHRAVGHPNSSARHLPALWHKLLVTAALRYRMQHPAVLKSRVSTLETLEAVSTRSVSPHLQHSSARDAPPPRAEGSCHAPGQLPLQFCPVKPNLSGATENTKSTTKSSTSCTVPSKKLSALQLPLLCQTQEARLNRAACASQARANITGCLLCRQRHLQSSATHLPGSLNTIKHSEDHSGTAT